MAKEQKKTKRSKPRYMTTYEAAELLGLSAGTLRVWRCQAKARVTTRSAMRSVTRWMTLRRGRAPT